MRDSEPRSSDAGLGPWNSEVGTRNSKLGIWWVAWLGFVLVGLGALAVAAALLVLARADGAGRIAGLGGTLTPVLLAGAIALFVGGNGLLLGVGMGRRLLSPGSHRAVILTTLLALAMAGFVVAAYLLLQPAALGDAAQMFVVALAGLYGAFALMACLHGIRSGLLNARTLGLAPGQVTSGILWGLGGAVAVLAVSAVNGLMLQALGQHHPQAEVFRWLEGRHAVEVLVVGLGVAVVAPAVEELFFRGYVFNAYLSEKGQGTAYVGSAVLFGLAHGLPSVFLGIFGMGLVLAFVYRRAGTILAPIIAHGLNNAMALVALLSVVRT